MSSFWPTMPTQNVCKEDLLALPELTTEEIRAMYSAAQAGKSICAVLPRKESMLVHVSGLSRRPPC